MSQANDLLNQIELTLGEDDPIVEAPPLVEVMSRTPIVRSNATNFSARARSRRLRF